MKPTLSATVGLLIGALVLGLVPGPASALDNTSGKDIPIRLRVTERFSPIGSIVGSVPGTGEAMIDGRVASGERSIWGGEMIQSPADATVRVSFDSVGEAALTRGALARFGVAPADDGTQKLVASIARGAVNFKLQPDAGAYVEAAGSAFSASLGARFTVRVLDDKADVSIVSGRVEAGPQGAQQRYILRPPAGQGGSISVAARATRQVQIQVTDENDKPVADLPILFSLANPCLGMLGLGAAAGAAFTAKTDNRGIATVPLIVGAAKCAGSIIAKVQGTDISYTYKVQIKGPQNFWSPRNSLVVAGAVAAGVVGGLAAAGVIGGSNSEQIQSPAPPKVNP